MVAEQLKYAIIELTPSCNLKCVHCYNWWRHEGENVHACGSYKKAFRLVDHLIKKTTVTNITFTGGEPTISERFVELVLHAKLKGKRVTIITNGNGPSAVYKQLTKMQVDMMEFSVHTSVPEVHDHITGVPGAWENAMKHMQLMIEHGIHVTPVIVITSLNYQYVEETVRFFFQKGIRSVMVNRYNLGGEGLNHPDLSANVIQLRETFQKLNQFAANYDIYLFSGVCTPHCILNPDDYPHIRFGSCSSNVYQRPLTFDLDGNLRLCNHSPVIVGNVYKQSLNDIFANPYVNEWDDLNLSFCRACTRLLKCKGGCRAASEQVGLSLKHEDPIVKQLEVSPFL